MKHRSNLNIIFRTRTPYFWFRMNIEPNMAFTRFTKLLIELTWTSFFRTLNKFEFVHLLVIKLEYPIFGFEQSNIVRPITSDVIEWLSWNLGKLSMHKYMKHCIVYKTWKLSISNAWINVKSKKAEFWWMGWSSAPQHEFVVINNDINLEIHTHAKYFLGFLHLSSYCINR